MTKYYCPENPQQVGFEDITPADRMQIRTVPESFLCEVCGQRHFIKDCNSDNDDMVWPND